MAPSKTDPITFPHTFTADNAYRIGASVFSLVGAIALGATIEHHDTKSLLPIMLPFLVFFGAFLLVITFRLEVDENGLRQRSLLGRKKANWNQISRLDQGRAYSIHGADNRELIWFSLISMAAQQAVAEEAIRCANLHLSTAKLEYPLKRQWIRA